jgi:hypothetical protein
MSKYQKSIIPGAHNETNKYDLFLMCQVYVSTYTYVEPLLCHDGELGIYTTPVSKQRLGKHVSTATNRRAKMEVLLKTGFSIGPCRGVIKKKIWGDKVKFCMGVCEHKT